MTKKIIVSLSVIAAVAAVIVGATTAFFSDTETSAGNTFTAGSIDLTVDSEQHYNGNVCIENAAGTQPPYIWSGNSAYPVPGTACDGTWAATDLGVQKFFNFGDVKPGDYGEDTISLHVDSNDAWLRLVITDVVNNDNGLTEPESAVDTTGGDGDGELGEKLLFSVWIDQGVTPGFQGKDVDPGEGDNIKQADEPELISAGTIDPAGETWDLPTALLAGQTAYFGVAWNLPAATGNEVQSDSLSATMEFQVEQQRNNPTPFQ